MCVVFSRCVFAIFARGPWLRMMARLDRTRAHHGSKQAGRSMRAFASVSLWVLWVCCYAIRVRTEDPRDGADHEASHGTRSGRRAFHGRSALCFVFGGAPWRCRLAFFPRARRPVSPTSCPVTTASRLGIWSSIAV